ncbi:MAG TPA: metalloregulator ArsR/SmtB family transcription factor [Anaerolineaceae bacterium]
MNGAELTQELLAFFKALSDANRLKIVGLLANKPYPVEQIAAILKLSESTVSHHLSRLAEAGLVEAQASGYYSVYSLKTDALKKLSRRLLSRETFSALVEDVDMDAFDRKVLHDYLSPDGRLKEIPAQRKKLEVILRHMSQDFKAGERYQEKKVNELLGQYHEDTATLRRELIGYKILGREKGEYWRIH